MPQLHTLSILFFLVRLPGSSSVQLDPPASRRQVLRSAAAVGGAAILQPIAPTNCLESSDFSANPLLTLSSNVNIPKVGYSLYKTPVEQVELGVQVALGAGIRHFDCGTLYDSNSVVGATLQQYIRKGLPDGAFQTPRSRRKELFITHKVSNSEQSTKPSVVRTAVLEQKKQALLDLQQKGDIRAVGVCHYSVRCLQEIVDAGLPPPQVVQLLLSPFNQHKDVVAWAQQHGCAVSCSAWSKLSGLQGSQKGWPTVVEIAKQRRLTNAQVLVRWAIQRGFLCVPRSSSKYKLERTAIVQNSWDGSKPFDLSKEEMSILDGLDEQLSVGQLGVLDGWSTNDIVDKTWDPTLLL